MDRPPLREGGVVKLWISALGEETFHEVDLPACCQRTAGSAEDSFACPSCGAVWQEPMATEPEECAFVERPGEERKGAA